MKKFSVIILLCLISCRDQSREQSLAANSKAFLTVFENSNGDETATYEETISYYNLLAENFPEISIYPNGETDSGKPLHTVIYNAKGTSQSIETLRQENRIVLINNGIHPGEPDGIDASMMLFRDLAIGKIKPLQNTIIVAIPVYNIGGSLNRNSTTRTNQNGPKEYGFRGNARNYDLNRDFIKADTKNTRAFAEIYHRVQPDLFIDTHVSNGADYQYTLTHLFTQHNKLGGTLGQFLHDSIMPALERSLNKKSWDITPYVNVFNRTPETGFSQFFDSPRYSTGYTTLFNTFGMMVETHMLKPYKQRVQGTYELLVSMMEIVEQKGNTIRVLRNKNHWSPGESYPLAWELDTTKWSVLNFKGYEGDYINSNITGKNRLRYDRSRPFDKEVRYNNYFKPVSSAIIPKAYVIPQGWHNILELLKLNNVKMTPLKHDTLMAVESYKILDYATRKSPYEGHYSHYNTAVKGTIVDLNFKKGDYLIYTEQYALRYLLETLEPVAPDSFFNWNYFDTILQQKEGFSPYVWEDVAHELLKTDNHLKLEFDIKVNNDEDFANNWYSQLDWIHKHSKFYEKAHLQYPIYRIL